MDTFSGVAWYFFAVRHVRRQEHPPRARGHRRAGGGRVLDLCCRVDGAGDSGDGCQCRRRGRSDCLGRRIGDLHRPRRGICIRKGDSGARKGLIADREDFCIIISL